MNTYYFVRHAKSISNHAGTFSGLQDVPLSEEGIVQAHALHDKIKADGLHFDFVYSSPLVRAYKTATIALGTILMKPHDSKQPSASKQSAAIPIIADHRLQERENKDWERSFQILHEKTASFMKEISAKHKEKHIIIFGHNGTIKSLIGHIKNMDWKDAARMDAIENCALTGPFLY